MRYCQRCFSAIIPTLLRRSVCPSVTLMRPAKAIRQNEMPFSRTLMWPYKAAAPETGDLVVEPPPPSMIKSCFANVVKLLPAVEWLL